MVHHRYLILQLAKPFVWQNMPHASGYLIALTTKPVVCVMMIIWIRIMPMISTDEQVNQNVPLCRINILYIYICLCVYLHFREEGMILKIPNPAKNIDR